jgi:hypothetical protein
LRGIHRHVAGQPQLFEHTGGFAVNEFGAELDRHSRAARPNGEHSPADSFARFENTN